MGITKREIASELGVSKRTVANYIEKLGLGNHVSRNGNTDFLDDFAAAAIAAALIDQLAKKDEQIAKLMETVADSTKAVQGAQALHHETAQALALESTEQKLSRWQRLRRAWRG